MFSSWKSTVVYKILEVREVNQRNVMITQCIILDNLSISNLVSECSVGQSVQLYIE